MVGRIHTLFDLNNSLDNEFLMELHARGDLFQILFLPNDDILLPLVEKFVRFFVRDSNTFLIND